MSETAWRDLFVGRDADLAVLQDAWRKAKAGHPQVVSLIAESGLGKTRLVQEFFSWLSTTEDQVGGEGYWPDRLEREHNARAGREVLSLNPDSRDCVGDGRAVPFLWWGVQLPDSNFVSTKLTEYDTRLKLHLLAYLNAVQAAELKREQLKSAGNTVLDVSLNFGEAIVKGAVGFAAPWLGVAFALAGSLKGVTGASLEARKRQETIDSLQRQEFSPAQAAAEQREDIADLILGNLEQVCSTPPEPLPRLPLVLVVDDAQWIKADLSLCKLLADLLFKAGEQQWPLLVIATSWEAEWKADCLIDWGGGSRRRISDLFAAMDVVSREHMLGPAGQLDRIVATAFPGLTADQSAIVLAKAEGNARYLYDILSYLEDNPQLFAARDRAAALTATGTAQVEKTSFEDFVRKRLRGTPEHVQAALGIASLQGMQFSTEIVTAAAERIALDMARQGLVEGENPHAFIRTESSAAHGEFRTRYYQIAADENLERLVDRAEAAEALRSALQAAVVLPNATDEDANDQVQIWQAQLALFGSSDEKQGSVAYEALYQLANRAYLAGDLLALQGYAQRWAEEWLKGEAATPGTTTVTKLIWIEHMLRECRSFELALRFSENILGATRRNLALAQSGEHNYSVESSEADLCQALERVATNLWYLGRTKETLAYYQEAYDYRAQRYGTDPSDLNLRNFAVSALQVAGAKAFHVPPAIALQCFKEALDLAESAAARVADGVAKHNLAQALHYYGDALQKAGQNAAALPFLKRAIELGRDETTTSSAMDGQARADNALVLQQRRYKLVLERHALLQAGDTASALGKSAEAMDSFKAGLKLCEALEDAALPPNENDAVEDLLYVSLFAERIYNLAKLKDPIAALPQIEHTLDLKRQIAERRPDFRAYNDLGTILCTLGCDLLALGRKEAAGALFDELELVVDRLVDLVEDEVQRSQHAACLFWFGEARRLQGRRSDAKAIFLQALELSFKAARRHRTPETERIVSLALERLAMIAQSEGDPEVAVSYLLPCMEMKNRIAAQCDAIEAIRDRAIIAGKLGALCLAAKHTDLAVTYLETAASALRQLAAHAPVDQNELARIEGLLLNAKVRIRLPTIIRGDAKPINPWQPPADWLETSPPQRDPPAIKILCPCGSGEHYRDCHGKQSA